MMSRLFVLLVLCSFLFSCEEKYTPDYVNVEPTVVVEGYIQGGESVLPPYVMLSKTYNVYREQGALPELFLGGAEVHVIHNDVSYPLTQFCLNEVDTNLIKMFFDNFDQIPKELLASNPCIYIDFFNTINPQEGERYDLKINFEGKELTSSTTIPRLIPLDSFELKQSTFDNTYFSLLGFITDLEGPDYYRLKLSINGGPFTQDFSSVADDALFDNSVAQFPINKPFDREENDFQIETAGMFKYQDTVSIQWQNIDAEQYEFWNSLEFARGSQGPFSSYVRAASNIKGDGIGVWAGSHTRIYTKVIE